MAHSNATPESLKMAAGINRSPEAGKQVWLGQSSCSVADFHSEIEEGLAAVEMSLADDIVCGIPLYRAERVLDALTSVGDRALAYMAEWSKVLGQGAGIVCIKAAYTDHALLDDVTGVLREIIDSERAGSAGTGDHFAPAGANDRLWNAHEKLCVASPELFVRYNANSIVPLVSRAWLGPHFQITTQVNVVHPGGQAQVCHRDYHMGFQKPGTLEQYPAHVHALSAALTLQGAIAHSDMPIESGPTQLLPGSQRYLPGYLAAHCQDFRDYFNDHYVQLPLDKGDTLFFNPAVFHAAGENRTSDCHRFANLMQIGSGYARSIETVDRARMCRALYATLAMLRQSEELDQRALDNVLAACAEGYPFPTNLDMDSPLGGMVPQSQAELMHQALTENWSESAVFSELEKQLQNRRSH